MQSKPLPATFASTTTAPRARANHGRAASTNVLPTLNPGSAPLRRSQHNHAASSSDLPHFSEDLRQDENGRWSKLCPNCGEWRGLGDSKSSDYAFGRHFLSQNCKKIAKRKAREEAAREREIAFYERRSNQPVRWTTPPPQRASSAPPSSLADLHATPRNHIRQHDDLCGIGKKPKSHPGVWLYHLAQHFAVEHKELLLTDSRLSTTFRQEINISQEEQRRLKIPETHRLVSTMVTITSSDLSSKRKHAQSRVETSNKRSG